MQIIKMESMKAALLCALFAVLFFAGGARAEGPEVVKSVDVERYMGTWYEIAHIPVYFQKKCIGGTTATYTLLPDGTVEVVNKCLVEGCKEEKAEGRAWLVDKDTNAKLKVSFIPWLRLGFLAGDYWIIGLGEDYEWAVVGHPDREYGWILSRDKSLTKVQMQKVEQVLQENGYDFSDFKMTDQNVCP